MASVVVGRCAGDAHGQGAGPVVSRSGRASGQVSGLPGVQPSFSESQPPREVGPVRELRSRLLSEH